LSSVAVDDRIRRFALSTGSPMSSSGRRRSADTAEAGSDDGPPGRADRPEQLAVRISYCYYQLGMTQQAIAAALGIGRARVIRLLADARRNGLVTITINSPLLENVELAERLAERYALDFAEVCLSASDHGAPPDEQTLARHVATGACDVVGRRLSEGMTIGLGWGVTLQAFAEQFDARVMRGVSVVALLGSLTRRSSMARYEASTMLAAKLGAECLYLPSPIVCDSAESRLIITGQPLFREIQQRAIDADLAIVSIGGLDSATIRAVGLVSDREFESVLRAGAVGNFLGYYIDAHAEIVDHPINERIVGIDGKTFMRIPERIMISAGVSKAQALHTVLTHGLCTGLVTDQSTARALLDLPKIAHR